jgi:hypothetical protein
MNDKTAKVRRKVERAKQHIADLDRRIHLFFTGPPNPYPILKEIDSETGDLVFKLGKCAPIPDDFPLIIGDALQNLRAALDHLVWQLILSNGNTPKVGTAGFPFMKCAENYKTESPKKVKGMAPEAIRMIDALQPYGGGNEDLYGLHLLNNVDKHRLLLICGAAHIATSVTVELSLNPQEFHVALPMPFNWTYPLKDGKEIFRILKEEISRFVQNPNFSFRIAFGDAEVMGGEPMLPPLHQLADLVDAVILHFDRFLK